MDNGDATQGHAMTSAEFAKLMGAYPQPAENPLPAYGGYMDNSPANFSFVNMNDYFGAETFESEPRYSMETVKIWQNLPLNELNKIANKLGTTDPIRIMNHIEDNISNYSAETFEAEGWVLTHPRMGRSGVFTTKDDAQKVKNWHIRYAPSHYENETSMKIVGANANDGKLDNRSKQILLVGMRYDAETFEAGNMMVRLQEVDGEAPHYNCPYCRNELTVLGGKGGIVAVCENESRCNGLELPRQYLEDYEKYHWYVNERSSAETFEAPYGGAGSLMDIGKSTPLDSFTTTELTTSSAIHGDFDEASLNYSGHQNLEVRAETVNGISAEEYYAEMEELTDGVASITNRFGDGVGIIQVDDEDLEDVSVEITDGDGDVVYEGILGDEDVPEMEEDDFYYSENNTKNNKSIGLLALGALAGVLSYPTVLSLFTKTQKMMAETPELIENPNTGNLDPAQYEELVVESTGYAVDVIPQGLDGSFMGSRFAALPTERYVEYNEPGIGAHTDIALNRDEMYLEPEMAMVQASESVKESQAPGQSPYNSMTGEENADFDMRVLKETEVVSLDPAVKPFIPQSMSGYTGNANTPPSVFNKMFNVGVLGQTPAFVPGSGDMGSSHTGSRSATPNALGLGGSVGGPLSDQVNSNYTDGQTSMSLAQWAIENTVSQTSDTEAVVIDRSSGAMKRVRRV